ncbi:MAG TPA: RDD family protein [Gemmataceae bacterium]|nr:RDD family protein [Gemmataceae bacterium]
MLLHEVITTEKVPFTYRVAGIGSRFLAWWCDLMILFGLLLVGNLFVSPLELGRTGVGMAVALLWQFALLWGYFVFFEWLWQGQTPGKRLLGIRVIDWGGTGVSFFQAAVRNILRAADGLPLPFFLYGLGFVVAACNREQRRLGDLAAGTLVVHVERKAQPIQALPEGRSEADRARQALLRQRLGQLDHAQKQTLLDLCLRRDQLRLAERTRLFRALAEYFQGRLDLAPAEYQSDEKFVLQLAAALTERGP